MVWSKLKTGEEVRAQYAMLNVSNNEIEGKRMGTNLDGTSQIAVTMNVRAVCGFEFGQGWSSKALLRGGRKDGKQGASIDKPFLISEFVRHVQQKTIIILASNTIDGV